MYKTQIGNLQITVDSRRLIIHEQGNSKIKVSLAKEDIHDLYTFLGKIDVNEKMDEDDDPRKAYRIPIPNVLGLLTKISFKKETLAVTAHNLSRSGIFVEYSATDDPEMAVGVNLNITLNLGSKSAEIPGIVRRRSGHSYGVSFPESTIDRPSESFLHIFKAIETLVLRLRVK